MIYQSNFELPVITVPSLIDTSGLVKAYRQTRVELEAILTHETLAKLDAVEAEYLDSVLFGSAR